jgi:hypothetical protein
LKTPKSLLLAGFLSFACATPATGPKQETTTAAIKAASPNDTKKLLDEAEQQLLGLDVESATARLDQAKGEINALGAHPDAAGLKQRHAELSAKVPEAQKALAKKKAIAAKGNVDVDRSAHQEALAAAQAPKAPAAAFEKARAAAAKLEASLKEVAPLEAEDPEYAQITSEIKKELAKDQADLEAKWLEVGVGLQKAAIDAELQKATAAMKPTGQASAKAEDFQKAEEALSALAAQLEKGQSLEAKDSKYTEWTKPKRTQLEAFQRALADSRKKAEVRLAGEEVSKAKTALEQALNALKTKTDEPSFAAAQTAQDNLVAALEKGKAYESTDAGYAKVSTGARILSERYPAELAAAKSRGALAAQKANVEEKRAAAKAAVSPLLPSSDAAAFSGAQGAITALEKALADGKALESDKTYATFAAGVAKEVEAHKATISRLQQAAVIGKEREQLSAVATNVEVRLGALGATPEEKQLDEAEQAIADLEKALKAGEATAATDKTYAAQRAALEKKLATQKAQLEKKKTEQRIAAHRTLVEAQKQRTEAALSALKGATEQGLYQKAEDEISALSKVLSEGEELGAADAKYAAELKRISDAIPGQRMGMRKTRMEATNLVALEKLKALEGPAQPTAFESANEAVRDLKLVIDGAKTLNTTDKTYLTTIAGFEKQAAAHQAAIEKRKVGLGVEKHRSTVDAAAKLVAERMKGLEGEPDANAFSAAEGALLDLRAALESVDADAEADKAHVAYLAQLKKSADAHASQLAKRRVEVAVALHKKQKDAAVAALTERLKGLDGAPEPAAFEAAEAAATELEKVATGAPDDAKGDAKYAAELKAAEAKVAPGRAQIEKRRTEVAVVAHKKSADAAAAALDERLKGKLDAVGLAEATRAVEALEQAINEGQGVAEKDPKHAAYLSALGKKVTAAQGTLERTKGALAIEAHQAEVNAQVQKLDAAIGALKGQTEQALYAKAEEEVSALLKVLQAGEELTENDAKYGAKLKAIGDAVPGKRMAMRKTRIEAHQAQVAEKLKALDGEPAGGAFVDAEEAVKDLSQVIDGAKQLSGGTPPYLAMLAAAEKGAAANTAAIEKRRVSLAVQKHKATVQAAAGTLAERMKALDAADAAAFDAAEAAAKELEGVAGSPDAVAESDPAHKAFLAANQKNAQAQLAVVQKKRAEAAVKNHRGSLLAAQAAVGERLKALAGEPEAAAFTAAEAAVGDLEKVIEGGDDAAENDAKYKNELAAAKGKVPGYRGQIARRQGELEVLAHRRAVDAAAEVAAERSKGPFDAAGLKAAAEAVEGLESAIASGEGAAAKDNKHAAYLAGLKKKVDGYRAALERGDQQLKVGAYRERLSAERAKLEAILASLEGQLEQAQYQKAEDAISRYATLLTEGQELEDGKLQKELAAENAALPKKRMAMRKTRIAAHDQVAVAKIGALAGTPSEAAFGEAEDAVKDLKTVIEGAANLSGADKAYEQSLAAAEKKAEGHQSTIEKRKVGLAVEKHKATVEAANAGLAAKLAALDGDASPGAFEAAEAAAAEVKGVAESVDGVAESDGAYKAYLAKTVKDAEAKKAQIEKRRAQAVVAGHKQQLAAAQASLQERLKALAGDADEPAFAAAEGAVSELEKVLESGADAGDKDGKYAAELKAQTGKIGGYRAQIERRRDEVAVKEHKESVDEAATAVAEKLKGQLDANGIGDAEKAVEALENAIAEGEEAAAKDKKHAAYLDGLRKKIGGYKGTLARAKVGQAIDAHRQRVKAQEDAVDAALSALNGQLEQGPYQKAEDEISEFSKVLASAGDLEDAKYEKELAAKSAALPGKRMAMRKIRIEANQQQVENRLAALEAKADDGAFAAAEEAVRDLTQVIEGARSLSGGTKAYNDSLAAAEKKAKGYGAAIEKRRVNLAVEKHKAGVEAAVEKMTERMKALGEAPTPDAADAATLAVDEVKGVAESVDGVAEGDPAYASYLAKVKKDAEAKRAEIGRRRTQATVAAHQAQLTEAQAAVSGALKALAGKPEEAAFGAAEAAVGNLEGVIKSGDAAAEADGKYKKTLAATEAKLGGYRGQIEKRKAEVQVLEAKEDVEAKANEVAQKLEAMDGDPAIAEAERAIEALEGALGQADELAVKDKKQLAFFAGEKKKIGGYRAKIEKQRFGKQVAAHAQELEAANQEVQAKIAALEGKTEHGLYQAAEDSVSNLKRVIDGAGELADKSAEHGKRLKAAEGRLPKFRMSIRRQRIESTKAELEEKLKALDAKPEDEDFRAAEGLVQDYGRTVEAARALPTGDKADQKYLGEAEKQIGKYEKRIEGKRGELAVAAHRGELEKALANADERLAALKKKPSAEDFSAAEEAISQLESAIDTGTDAAEKDAKYKARLKSIDQTIKGRRAEIEERRFDAEVAGHKEKVQASIAKVTTTLEALGPTADGSAFSLAEDAVGELEGVLKEGETYADQNANYKKQLAAEEKKLGAYRGKIEKKRQLVALAEHVGKLEAAEAAAAEAIKGLSGEAKADDFGAAESALEALEQEIEAGAPLAKADKAHQKRLVAAKKLLPKRRAAITSAKSAQELAAHKKSVEEAASAAEERLGALEGKVSGSQVKAAEDSIDALVEALNGGKALGKKNKKHGAYLASVQKKVGGLKKTLAKKAIQGEVASHEARLEAAEQDVQTKLDAVKGQLEFSLYQAVEESISDLKKVVDDGAELAEKDDDYGKRLRGVEKGLDGFRMTMRRRWIEAADAAAEEKMKVLEGKPDEADFAAAESAVRDLENTTDSGKRLKTKDKEYQQLLASADKTVKRYKSAIGKRRSALEFGDVRQELASAVEDASAKMSALGKAPSEEDHNAAMDSLDALDRALEAAAPAAESDPAYKKKLSGLKKKLTADRSKLEKLKKANESKPQLERLAAAEANFDEKVAALKAGADETSISAAEDAAAELEASIDEVKSSGKETKALKKRVAKDSKKLVAARTLIKKKNKALAAAAGASEAGSGQKAELEGAITNAKEALLSLNANATQDDLDRAKQSSEDLSTALEAAKKNKKLAKLAASGGKTNKKLKAEIKAKTKLLAKRNKAAESEAVAEGEEEAPADDYPQRLSKALANAKAELKVLAKKPKDEVALTSARAAADELEALVEESKSAGKPKPAVAKKLAAAKKLLKANKKKLVVKESAVAREDSGGGDDPQRQVAAAWASFSKQMKAIKKKKPTVDAIDNALQAASDVEAALEEGQSSSVGQSAKFKKYSASIKKKLKKAKAKLNKARRTAGSSVG